ncbi:MAG TPA: sugar transferase [Acidobacteriota bacterium]|jgi:lipopolysaccharide/colanic/teichoic acid biosynthesis glycosyltransferase
MKSESGYAKQIKRVMDVCGAALLGGVLALPALAIAALVWATSPGPILIRQRRLGKDGLSFTMFKFRTMRQDAENGVPVWARANDPRCTAPGGFLRRTGLDEIPQLWNILRGDMSLVGPRPERPEFAQIFTSSLPDFPLRHQVLPGLTGLAQIRGWRGDSSIADRLKSDLEYISNWSPAVDLWILTRTLPESIRHFRSSRQ